MYIAYSMRKTPCGELQMVRCVLGDLESPITKRFKGQVHIFPSPS